MGERSDSPVAPLARLRVAVMPEAPTMTLWLLLPEMVKVGPEWSRTVTVVVPVCGLLIASGSVTVTVPV